MSSFLLCATPVYGHVAPMSPSAVISSVPATMSAC